MDSIITGLFQSQSQSKKISQDLKQAGFHENDFIMYLHEEPISKEIKTSIWQSFFKDHRKLEDESFVVSVKLKAEESPEKVNHIFLENQVIHQNLIQNIKFKEAESLQFLKRIVALRAKSLIFSPPKPRHRDFSRETNFEVFLGKKC